MSERDTAQPAAAPQDFIREIVAADVAAGKNGGRVVTRFPPEPNGYLHIGHAKAICLDFGVADEFGGYCNLRFDDTNPVKEDVEYVDSIKQDVEWLGFHWRDREYYASDYYEQLYQYAEALIRKGVAYVDSLSADEIREHRGTLTEPGKDSPHRTRSADENLDLFRRMRAGEFPDGAHVLRAKIDMRSPNITMRDPVLYRIRHAEHHRTGTAWCIYPMYDFAHPLSDAIEGVTHSLCTLEYVDHRPLYDWVIEHAGTTGPPAAIRVRAAQPELHGDEQAQAAAAGRAEARERLGRSADADRDGIAPPRLHAGVDPRLLRARRRGEERERHRRRPARALRARRPQSPRAAGDGGAAPAEAGAHELPDGSGRRNGSGQPSGQCVAGFAARAVLPRDLHRTGGLPGGPAEEVLPAGARPRSAPSQCLPGDVHGGDQERRRRDRRAARHLRSRHARRRRARRPQGQGDAALGVGPRTRPMRKCGSTIACSRPRIRKARPRKPARTSRR